MKTQLTLIFFAMSFGFFHAQEDKKNIVKSNLTAFAFRNYNLTYERAIKKWLSVNVSYAAMPKGNVPFLKSFLGSDNSDEFSNLEVSSNAITLETRFYLGKGYGKGFYLAPYYRNSQLNAENFVYDFYYTNGIVSQDIPVNVNGKTSENSFGLLIGTQFFLNKQGSLVLDLWILGGHYGTANGDFTLKSNMNLTPDQQQQLITEIEDLNLPVVKYTVTSTANGADVKMNGPWAGLRSGLSLGYRF